MSTPTPTPTATAIAVTCDGSIGFAFGGTTNQSAMYDSALPNTLGFAQDDSTGTRLAIYHNYASAPVGASQTQLIITPNSGATAQCEPCVVAVYGGKNYLAQSGVVEYDLTNGASSNLTVTISNLKMAPADGNGGGWCIQSASFNLPITSYACTLVGASNNCATLGGASAQVTCSGDTMSVVQNCSSAAKTCSAGACR